MTLNKRTRFEVLKRDDYTCRYCHSADRPMTVDHVIPVALGGSDKPSNLVAACVECNNGKASSHPDANTVDLVTEDALRWAAAMREASARMAMERAELDAYIEAFECAWAGSYGPSDWRGTLGSLRQAGLPLSEMLDAADVALSARSIDNRFRYFCGVAWRKVSRLQEMARLIVEEGGAQ